MKVGGVKLERGKIVNMVIDSLPSAPTFNPEKVGEFTFSLSDKVLRFNDGEKLTALNTSVSEDPILKSSLGSNWLNADLSFNPVPFNELPGITGLNSTHSLFDVIDQITGLIENVSSVSLNDIDLSNVIAPDMAILAYLAGDLIFVGIESVLEGSTISLDFDNLRGFNITSTTEGNMLIFKTNPNTAVDEIVSKKFHYTYTQFSSGINHQINHNLGVTHCAVFCINPQTNTMIQPTGITYINESQLIVNLPTSSPLKAFVFNMEPPA